MEHMHSCVYTDTDTVALTARLDTGQKALCLPTTRLGLLNNVQLMFALDICGKETGAHKGTRRVF